jgi:hypothetical protein
MGLTQKSKKIKFFIYLLFFAKQKIKDKKTKSTLPERPIKVPFRGFRGLQKRFLKVLSPPHMCQD